MTAKDKQKEIISKTLKPLMKKWGYKTTGQNWWKINGDFFNVINLQNFSWNSKEQVDFCFNFATGLTKDITGKVKVTVHNAPTHMREVSLLPETITKFRDKIGYHLISETNIQEFANEITHDFEIIILPKLDSLNSLENILEFYKEGFFAENLRKYFKQEGLKI
jgi:hypothetical protein